jgi:hypothetical protein
MGCDGTSNGNLPVGSGEIRGLRDLLFVESISGLDAVELSLALEGDCGDEKD